MSGETLPANFSANYAEARKRFIDAGRASGYTHDFHVNSGSPSPDTGPLYTDTMQIGPDDAKKLLFVTSGVHGVEGFTGSAIQLHALSEDILPPLPEDMAVIFVHALNPYGFAYGRRVNEHNVDLNRNFIDWRQQPPADHPLGAAAQKALLPEEWSWPNKDMLFFLLRHGFNESAKALTRGNYNTPDGLFYGGQRAEWSNVIWNNIISSAVTSHTRHIAHIDLHTGLGPYGQGELITCAPVASDMFKRAQSWWGTETVNSPIDGKKTVAKSVPTGLMNLAFKRVAENVSVTTTTLEFGTLSSLKVLHALALDNWVHAKGQQDTPLAETARRKMMDAFCPTDPKWRRMVVERGTEVILQAKRGLDLA